MVDFAKLLAEAKAKKAAALAAQLAQQENQNGNRDFTGTSTGLSNVPVSSNSTTSSSTSTATSSNSHSGTAGVTESIKERLARIREAKGLGVVPAAVSSSPAQEQLNTLTSNNTLQGVGRTGELISYNEQQLRFMQVAGTGESCILIGAAGTGKTTCMRGTMETLIQNGLAGIINDNGGHKYLPVGTPGIVVCAYTRRAVANIRRNMPENMKNNCITIHKLLEYEPNYYDVIDPETGTEKSVMKFEPTRNENNPISRDIHTVVIEEASMVSVELFQELVNALPHCPQFIFLGDIQQLPPVFGSAILGYKMLELTTVELTQVYRQALESPIIRLAHRILSGKPISAGEYADWKVIDKLTLHPWKKKLHPDIALATAAKFFTTAIDSKVYDPNEDQILIPFNKSFGTLELNKHIAQHMARKRQAIVYEVIAGFNKHYFSIGDEVLVDKEDAQIIDISPNPVYAGMPAQPHSQFLDYWGYNSEGRQEQQHHIDEVLDSDDFMLENYAADEGERVRKCSHVITVLMHDSGQHVKIDTASDVNNMLLAYALTVHKSQGSEWRKVFLVLHQSHATMLQRELLYTAVTRAKEELYVICEPESFTKGIESQKIKGNTLAEKAEFFKGKPMKGN